MEATELHCAKRLRRGKPSAKNCCYMRMEIYSKHPRFAYLVQSLAISDFACNSKLFIPSARLFL